MRARSSLLGFAALLSCAFAPWLHAQSGGAAAWVVSPAASGRLVASIRSRGAMRGVSIGCQGSAPMLLVAAPQNGARAKASLEMTGTVEGSTITVPMIWNPQFGAWWAILRDRTVPDLLSGASNSVFMAMNGVGLGTLPLAGSSNAIRTALARCYVPAAAPVATTGGAEGSANRNSLPLRFGTYVRAGKKCGADVNAQVFIDARMGAVTGGPLESLRKTGTNTYVAREDVGHEETEIITATYALTDREHFTVRSKQAGARTYGYCPLTSLPLDQQQWPADDHKEVQSLPIRPGYYHARTVGDLKCEYCSYYLFRNDGIATVHTGFAGPDSRRALRQMRITRTGALDYSVMRRGTDEVIHTFTIRSPTDFTEEDVESTISFRPVEPAKIPARYMPRL